MQQIIKNGELAVERWHLLPKDGNLEGIPNSDDIIVPLALWREHAHALKARDGGLGVWLDADELVEEIADQLAHFQVVALNFPAFTDGRHYSSARLLRERYGYRGEVRAIGDVLRDQLFAMARCGFDAFAVRPDRDPQAALEGLKDFSVTYQAAADDPRPLFRRRACPTAPQTQPPADGGVLRFRHRLPTPGGLSGLAYWTSSCSLNRPSNSMDDR